MFTIAVVNRKAGKSTLAQCLAVAAYLDDKGVAILDMDPQGVLINGRSDERKRTPIPW